MNDDPIAEYLRARGRIDPPLDFVPSVQAALADAPQRRASWFAPFLPAAAAVGAAAIAVALALMIGQNPFIGPAPTSSPVASASPTGSNSPTSSPVVGGLADPGDVVELPALDTSGEVGTITLVRGQDAGGYPMAPDPTGDTFFVEVQVTYDLTRVPDPAEWGRGDWTLVVADGALGGLEMGPWDGQVTSTAGPQPTLADYPGAIVAEPGQYDGWLIFAVPREASDGSLNLRYTAAGRASAVESILLRDPGQAPEAVTGIPASPEPIYAQDPGYPFPVLDSPAADALFAESDECTSAEGGYTLRFPESWYTNTAVGATPACSWFSPTSFEVAESGIVPGEIVIEIRVSETGLGQIPEWPRVSLETVSIGGYEGSRMEDAIPGADGEFEFVYHYAAWLDDDALGRKITAHTSSDGQPDYLLHRAVLDRIMASLVFRDPEAEAAAGARADALFADPDTCTNPEDGYMVTLPDAWYTNTAIGDTPACSWFTPEFFQVTAPGEPPDEIWISIAVFDGGFGYTSLTQIYLSEQLEVGGRPASRVEYNPNTSMNPGYRGYVYVIPLGENGPTLAAGTNSDDADDYLLAKAVLDRIMASFESTR